MKLQGVTVLGATGSIGKSTLDVIARHPDRYRVVALTAHRQIEALAAQCIQFSPDYAVVADEQGAEQLQKLLLHSAPETTVLYGVAGLEQVAAAPEVDQVMAAIVGAAGLKPTLAAVRAGKRILLANKEALVMTGALFMEEVERYGAELLPIDSEHNAIFQCMPDAAALGAVPAGVEKILLTGSGGPFRDTALDQLKSVTPEQAVAHPNWSMGRKISVDSATMMNKGLEFIEACWLFGATPEQVQVVLHPQSVIHSMVQYNDGSVMAQMGNPDMRTPIAYAMAWPERIHSGVSHLDLFEVAQLNFQRPDFGRYPCLHLAIEAMRTGGSASTIVNAANEVAVDAFLNRQMGYLDIARVIEYTLNKMSVERVSTVDQVLAVDQQARQIAQQEIQS
ncbi:MAG: 1-deoxy-D-xylulose-5-phosphate reductoisomerase [Gammaproteobacteria bacterium]|jgi:1-deoxy-D-xylulose-5-phosphate reductoisomerase|nr:1-deoxy-D-xylulose-5-phosphate reductoisomerase [Gammaproteobacteria bacterium]MBT4606679.1 1-deoxy-D-xylulose-5-phosphate reductoisomerase [Thiotrichales bacterium]MBT3472139.1 1-deoxy-D-xylulose-5-phosphate reductoisomerase [Gammaproteobacteria bacterium]MBT3967172.1 1-deoxy-D-xylulose-5-phosphate reductoisomerase [Gammaproteobacteria bacterium]MBT4079666.1 1-deoxy-D-xylulose-5-phosphate reductoisomerase [Gammaproteobacteria bacterium]